MSKAFDKPNHYALFVKLMDRTVPLAVMNVLVYWYSMCSAVVRLNNTFSSVVQLQCGIRHCGVLSPVSFAVYVTDLILAISSSGHGCYFNNMFVWCMLIICCCCLPHCGIYSEWLISVVAKIWIGWTWNYLLHHMRVVSFSVLTLCISRSNSFSEPVLQHLVNVYCKPYLLCGADVIDWTRSELASIRSALNCVMCKIYKA